MPAPPNTVLTLLSPSEIPSTPFLPSLFQVINLAFHTSHVRSAHLFGPDDPPRLDEPTSFIDQLRDDPSTFIYIVHRPNDPTHAVLATVSCRRHLGPHEAEVSNPWARQELVEEGWAMWEVRFLAVDPALQKQGVAGWLLDEVDKEVLRREEEVEEKEEEGEEEEEGEGKKTKKGKGKGVKMILTTIKEIQASFYMKRGYRWDYERETVDGRLFTIVFMSKEMPFEGEAGK